MLRAFFHPHKGISFRLLTDLECRLAESIYLAMRVDSTELLDSSLAARLE